MGNTTFDFNKIKRSFCNVTLKDGRKLLVKMPRKSTFEKINTLQAMPEDVGIDEMMDIFAALCAEILSNNMSGEVVTRDYMAEDYDTEDMILFIHGFMDFVTGVQGDPN